MKHAKIAIIGAGSVGSTIAYTLLVKNIAAEIVLIDINQKRCMGEVYDISDALSFSGTSKIKTADIENAKNADIIIVAAGIAQKPEQTREDLVKVNKKIVTSIMRDLNPANNDNIVIMVTNPVDAMTFYAQQASGLPHQKIFGTGTFLDTQRLRGLISKKLNIAEQSIHAYILGEHGDSQFPAWSTARIAGTPIINFPEMSEDNLEMYAKKTREKVYEIIKCKGATYFGIAACVSALCENIIFNQQRIAPVSTFIKKFNLYISLPAVIGYNGIQQVIPIPLNEKEQGQLEQSAQTIQKTIDSA